MFTLPATDQPTVARPSRPPRPVACPRSPELGARLTLIVQALRAGGPGAGKPGRRTGEVARVAGIRLSARAVGAVPYRPAKKRLSVFPVSGKALDSGFTAGSEPVASAMPLSVSQALPIDRPFDSPPLFSFAFEKEDFHDRCHQENQPSQKSSPRTTEAAVVAQDAPVREAVSRDRRALHFRSSSTPRLPVPTAL